MTLGVQSQKQNAGRELVSVNSRLPAPRKLPLGVWAIKELLVVLAVFSLVTWQWEYWIDLRFLGSLGAALLMVLWTLSLLMLNFAAGPRIVIGRSGAPPFPAAAFPVKLCRWSAGRAGMWTCQALLIPTYLMMACLAANLFRYNALARQNHIDCTYHVPTCALLLILLAAWLCLFFRWQRTHPAGTHPITQRQARVAGVWILVCLVGLGWCFYLPGYVNPPRQPVDVAVVFGHKVMPDGTASDTLRARTMAAVELYRQNLARHILVSGETHHDPDGKIRSEAWAMRNVCIQAGVPPEDIFFDPWGDNTRASAYDTRRVMDRQGWHSVVGVSSAYHLRRIAFSFHELGIAAYTAAAHPTVWVPVEPYDMVRETIGNFVYWTRAPYHQSKGTLMDVRQPRIVVHKTTRQLHLFDGDRLAKTYACFTGTHPGDKEREGDRKTPEGTYRIVFKNPQSKFHLSLGLDYPNHEDARRGLESGLLTQQQYHTLLDALDHGDMTAEATQNRVWKTPLGGEIFIHGGAEHRDTLKGSAGCVVVSNPDIEELFAVCQVGTPVTIEP